MSFVLQEHIHGNVNNDTDITRVSMDVRVLIEGEPYHRKLPGDILDSLEIINLMYYKITLIETLLLMMDVKFIFTAYTTTITKT